MKWLGVSLLLASVGAWGQAAVEYGVATSNSAAATAATMKKLNEQTSAVLKSVPSVDRATSATPKTGSNVAGSARKAQPRRSAPTKQAVAAASPEPPAAPNRPAAISVQGGAVRSSGAAAPKYPGVIQVNEPPGPSANQPKPPDIRN